MSANGRAPDGHHPDPRHDATRALLGRGSVFALAQALQLGAAIVVVPFVTRTLDPAQFGTVAAALTITKVVAVLATLGLPAAITLEHFNGSRGPNAARVLVATCVAASSVTTGLGVATSDAWADSLTRAGLGTMRVALVLAGLMAAVIAVQALLQAHNRVREFVVLTALSTVGGQGLGLAMTQIVRPDASAYLSGLAVGHALALLLGLWQTMRPLPRWDRTVLGPALRVALPTVPHSIALHGLALGDRLVIGRALGLEQVGRYDIAYQVGALAIVAVAAYNQAWAPIVYGAEPADRWRILSHTSGMVTRLAACAAVGLCCASPLVLSLAAPSSYTPADLIPVTCVICVCVLPFAAYLARVHVVFQCRATGVLAWTSPLAAVTALVACAVLVHPFGLVGAALASVVGYLVQALATGVAARRLADVEWRLRETGIIWVVTALVAAASTRIPATPAGWALRLVVVVLAVAGAARTAATAVGRSVSPSQTGP